MTAAGINFTYIFKLRLNYMKTECKCSVVHHRMVYLNIRHSSVGTAMVELYTHPLIRLCGVVLNKLSTGTTLPYLMNMCIRSSLLKYEAASLLLNDHSVFTVFQQNHHCPKSSSYWQVETLPVGFGRIGAYTWPIRQSEFWCPVQLRSE
jgi:hypothetical protein